MSLIVEDGTIVTDADSYVSVEDYATYAAARGVTLADTTTNVAAAEVELIKAAQFIDSHEAGMKGTRVSRDQTMAFPRDDVEIDGWTWSSDEVPRNVVLCQLAVALELHAGEDPYNPPQEKFKTQEVVEGAVSVTYAAPTATKMSKTSKATALLNSFLKNSGLTLTVTRA